MKKVWQTAAALALAVLCGSILAPSAAAVELDFNGIYEHPVRVAVGVVCLVAAVVLLLYRLLRHPMDNAKRSRSYGGGKTTQGASAEPYRRSRRKKRAGSGVFGLLLPNYKGRKQERSGPSVSVAVPERHRSARRRRTASPILGFSNRPYKGGGSAAGTPDLRAMQPDSYKAPWGSKGRYGRLRLQAGSKRYQGGGSAAGTPDLRAVQPDSYREPWGRKLRYGRFSLPALPIPYLGRRKGSDGTVPGPHTPARHTGKGLFRPAPAKVTYAEPERYRDRFGLRRRYGMKNPSDEIPIYHGGSHVLRAAKVALAAPPSYREPWGSRARYGKGAIPSELPLSYREPWGRRCRYGREPVAYELPLSYREPWGLLRRYGAGDPLERTAQPERPPYLGGSTTTAKEPWIDPETGRLAEPVQPSAKQYGNRRYGGKLYGGRIVHYREEEPLDSSTVVHDAEDALQAAAHPGAIDT